MTDFLSLIRTVAPPTPVEPLTLDGPRRVLLKREDTGPNGTFKWRGALAACEEYRLAGATDVVTASTGNHGAAVAWAARRLGLRAHVAVPRDAVAGKCAIIEGHGAQLHRVGDDLGEASAFACAMAEQEGIPYFEDGATAAQLDGTATVGHELNELDGIDAIFIPVACGALAGGIAKAVRARGPATRLVGVQSIHFSRMTALFHERSYTPTGEPTFADGLADDRLVEPALSTCMTLLDELIAVNEDDLRDAVRELWNCAGITAEGAGAAALAGLLSHPERTSFGDVVVVVSGGNLDPALAEEIHRSQDRPDPAPPQSAPSPEPTSASRSTSWP